MKNADDDDENPETNDGSKEAQLQYKLRMSYAIPTTILQTIKNSVVAAMMIVTAAIIVKTSIIRN